MERFAEIENGVVVNIAVVDPGNIPDHMTAWVPCGNADIDWRYDGSTFTPPEQPTITLAERRNQASLEKIEFCVKFNELGVLPDDELIDAASGGFPATFASAISHLPIADQARIRGQWTQKTHIDRTSSTLAFMADLMSVTDSQLDEAFGVSSE